MPKLHSFDQVRDHIYNRAPPSRPDRIAMKVAGNPDVFEEAAKKTASAPRAKGGRTSAHEHLAKRGLKLEGVSPAFRADRPSRSASGGRNKHKGVGGLGHVLIIGLPHTMGNHLSNKDEHHAIHHAKHRQEIKRAPHATSGGGHAHGGAVSRGDSLQSIRRKTQP
jgi:hypothetical protein